MGLLLTSTISEISGFSRPLPPVGQELGRPSSNTTKKQQDSGAYGADRINLSLEGRSRLNDSGSPQTAGQPPSSAGAENGLTPEEQQQLRELKSRDREVRAHEQAHLSAAGQYAAGGPSFTYQQGPDGNKYAIGGEVPIDISKESSPEETIKKMQVVQQAALAPAEPSSADRQIAAQAAALAAQARQELATEQAQDGSSGEISQSEAPPGESAEQVDPNENYSGRTANSGGVSVAAMIQAYTSIQDLGRRA